MADWQNIAQGGKNVNGFLWYLNWTFNLTVLSNQGTQMMVSKETRVENARVECHSDRVSENFGAIIYFFNFLNFFIFFYF